MCPLQIGCTDDGILNGIDVTIYNNCGWCNNDDPMGMAVHHIDNGRQIHHYNYDLLATSYNDNLYPIFV